MSKRFHIYLNILIIVCTFIALVGIILSQPTYGAATEKPEILTHLKDDNKNVGGSRDIESQDDLDQSDIHELALEQKAEDQKQEAWRVNQALLEGDFPYQLLSSTGNNTPSRYGPQRNDPSEGIPKHAYSPFDEKNNREHPCPPGGCEYMEGQLLIKFSSEVQIQETNGNEITTNQTALNQSLQNLGVDNLEPIFPNAKKPSRDDSVLSLDNERIPMPDLTLWHRAFISEDSDVLSTASELSTLPGILYAEPDFLRKPVGNFSISNPDGSLEIQTANSIDTIPGPTTDPLYSQQWHLDATNVPQAWAYLEGLGLPPGGNHDIIVAVIDTGVDYSHPDLAANMWVNPPEFNGRSGVDDDGNGFVDDIYGADTVYQDGNPMDDHGHGTHVAGIIGATANNDLGGVGVAYNVQIMALKAAQYSGVLSSSDIAEAIYYAVQKGADVINMSFGGYSRSTVEEEALTVAFSQAVLVAAAGNDAKVNLPCPGGRDMYPAAYNWVIGIMSSDSDSNLSGFSNTDCVPKDIHEYELMAPGIDIWSTLPADQYAAWDGTSMSAPVVSGIAALARTK